MKLEVRDIRKSFGDREILHGISFEVVSGRAMGFLGRNGAGKSTTIRCLMDVFRQDAGEFYLDGKPFKVTENRVGYLPEERGMYQKNKILDQLVYFARLRGASKADATRSANEWIDFFELGEYKNKPLETLSKGNQQKIQIAQAFLNDPDILILDEPFSGLDPLNSQIFKDAIADVVAKGRLVIFSSHQMNYVEEVCDDVTLIHEGDILLSGDLKALKRQMGQNKLALSVDGMTNSQVGEAVRAQFPQITLEHIEDMLVLDTHQAVTQQDILRFIAAQGWNVARFGMYEPSLNDIFVAKVRDHQ
ncbi:MAG TPA: ATP-binding cassette domain-containing protein [Clostridiales bacterium]|nr:ATP-binding cassette domain-containing protein [Clostridiales bacterium]